MFSSHPIIFLMGALSVVLFKGLGKGVGSAARPLVKGVVKGGIVLGRQVQEIAGRLSESVQDVAAEASAELAGDRGAQGA